MRGRVRRVSSEGDICEGTGYEGGTVTGEGRGGKLKKEG